MRSTSASLVRGPDLVSVDHAALRLAGERRVGAGFDRGSRSRRELRVGREVVDAEQPEREDLAARVEVTEVRARVGLAALAVTARVERLVGGAMARLLDVHASLPRERLTVPRVSRR